VRVVVAAGRQAGVHRTSLLPSMRVLILFAFLSLAYGAYAATNTRRIIGYWDSWNARPSNTSAYTHIYFAFLAKTSGASGCGGWTTSWSSSDVSYFKNAGKTVILSVGGATSSMNWNGCTWNQTALEITKVVKQYGFDGADIDYEENPVSSWITGVTKDLRAAFNANGLSGKLITHVPQSYYMTEGGNQAYWNPLATVKTYFDFVIIQYYNNDPEPNSNPSGAVTHYTNIVNGLFGGDASKVVFGICLTDCGTGGGDLTVSQADSITKTLLQKFPSNFGGIAIWATSADANAGYQWSKGIASTYKSVASLVELRGKADPSALQP